MSNIDKRGRLNESVFAYRTTKSGSVLISWNGRLVTTLRGDAAVRLLAAVQNTTDLETQLALAKATGHFKHGNERREQE